MYMRIITSTYKSHISKSFRPLCICMFIVCVYTSVSVEEILSYGVRKRYSPSKQLSSSAKILADIGKTFPVAAATFDKCYGSKVGRLPPGVHLT